MALVSYVLGNCPGCGAVNTFGNIDVRSCYVSRGCFHCRYHEKLPLPKIKKAIIYLDQFFYSHAFRESDHLDKELQELIQQAASNQLLVAPYSSIHEDETNQWSRRNELMDFIKAASRGHEFEPDYQVERKQLTRAFRAWLNSESSDYVCEESDVMRDNPHAWDSYYRIDVGRYLGDVDQIRKRKQQSVDELVGLFDVWAASESSFQDDLFAEHKDAGKGYWDAYGDYARRLAEGDIGALIYAPIASDIIRKLYHCIPDTVAGGNKFKEIAQFLTSAHFRNVPYQDISSRSFATLKAQVKEGAYSNREKAKTSLRGFFYDVRHVATYAPYCDAIFIDKAMAQLMSRREMALSKRYGVKIFSQYNIDEFKCWIGNLMFKMSEEHRNALYLAYPDIE